MPPKPNARINQYGTTGSLLRSLEIRPAANARAPAVDANVVDDANDDDANVVDAPGANAPPGPPDSPIEGIPNPVAQPVAQQGFTGKTFVYIFHGWMEDVAEGQIETEEDLEKKRVYLHNLKWYSYEKLKLINQIEWRNIEVFYYNHSSDTIWSKMFTPPIYWDPVDSGNALSKATDAVLFGRYEFANSELTEANIETVRKIAEQLEKGNKVLLYGFSVGGFVVQRICEILNTCVQNETVSKLILGLVLEEEDLNNFKVATFGSNYIASQERVKNIDIKNYMLVDDVVTKTNFFEFGFGYIIPSFDNFFEIDGEKGYIANKLTGSYAGQKLYQFMQYENSNIIYLQRMTGKGWWWAETPEVVRTNFKEYKVEELKELFNTHNNKYDLLFNKLLKYHITDFAKLESVQYSFQTAAAQMAQVAQAVAVPVAVNPAIQNIRVEPPGNSVDELIQKRIVVFDDNFYLHQRQFVEEQEQRQKIDAALQNIQTIRREMIEADDALDAAENAEEKKKAQDLSRDVRVKKREALQDLRIELEDISEHTANDILELHSNQNVPIILAKEPEENILDFSLIMAQLETKAMFLEGDGLKNLRVITRDAIDRGKAKRDTIPAAAAAAAAAAGGGKRKKKGGSQAQLDVTGENLS